MSLIERFGPISTSSAMTLITQHSKLKSPDAIRQIKEQTVTNSLDQKFFPNAIFFFLYQHKYRQFLQIHYQSSTYTFIFECVREFIVFLFHSLLSLSLYTYFSSINMCVTDTCAITRTISSIFFMPVWLLCVYKCADKMLLLLLSSYIINFIKNNFYTIHNNNNISFIVHNWIDMIMSNSLIHKILNLKVEFLL